MINILTENKSGSALLKSTEKMYLNNPDIYSAVADEIGREKQIGTIREIFFYIKPYSGQQSRER